MQKESATAVKRHASAYGNPDKGIVGNAFETLAPRRSTQYELGLKQQWQELLFTAALFDLTQDHQYTNLDNYYVTDGEQHNLGLELGLQGRVAENLDMTSTLALTRSRLEDIQSMLIKGIKLKTYRQFVLPVMCLIKCLK